MISRASAKAVMRQRSIHTKRDERLGWTIRDEWLGFTGGLLDKVPTGVFTAAYISQIDT